MSYQDLAKHHEFVNKSSFANTRKPLIIVDAMTIEVDIYDGRTL